MIKPYVTKDIDAVREFNKRLIAGGVFHEFALPESEVPKWLPKIADRDIYQEYFLAWEGNYVRGGYQLKHQNFSFNGIILSIAGYHLPLSEGIVDRRYNLIGIQMMRDALGRQPKLFALGMGSYDKPLPTMLKALHWEICSIPFYFKVLCPFSFLREIRYLRTSRFRKGLMDLLAVTGIGWAAIKLSHARFRTGRHEKTSVFFEVVDEFSHWADEVWHISKDAYSMIAVRDSNTLNILYPSDSEKFVRLKIMQGTKVVGWAVVLNTMLSNHKQFGNMHLGSIIDCLALPQDASKVIKCATEYLEKARVHLIVSNQSHSSWCLALKDAGFISGPSNMIFALSRELSKLAPPSEDDRTRFFVNRGDGDGPIHL